MNKGEGLFKFLFCNGYCVFISSDPAYEKIVENIGGTFIRAINSKCACGLAIGLKFAGVRAVIIVDNNLNEFIHACLTLCSDYNTSIMGLTLSNIKRAKELPCFVVKNGYEAKIIKRLKDVDNNISSLLLVLEEEHE